MPRSSISFGITPDKKNKKVERLLEEWPERINAIIRQVPRGVATEVHRAVVSAAPTEIEGYPDMLRVVEVSGREGWHIVGVLPPGWVFSQRLRSVDAQRTVLYVRPKMIRGEVVSEASAVLARYNPWTMDTLPYEPTKREASIVSRRVQEREVRPIEAQRRTDATREVIPELKRLGAPARAPGKVLLSRRVSRDLGFEILRYEFGIEVPGKAHWRPALRQVGRLLGVEFKTMEKWFADPADEGWKQASELPVEKASVMGRVRDFQDLVYQHG